MCLYFLGLCDNGHKGDGPLICLYFLGLCDNGHKGDRPLCLTIVTTNNVFGTNKGDGPHHVFVFLRFV